MHCLPFFGESFKLAYVYRTPAVLPFLAFDGASKRNRPNLLKGSLIYARVKHIEPHMDPELSCEGTH